MLIANTWMILHTKYEQQLIWYSTIISTFHSASEIEETE